jgi:ATP-dependent helicase YprA (DUF1998 family)
MRLHKHQSDAVKAAQFGENYVLTTGTGSGKSFAYIIPIVNHVLRRGSGKGIQAVIIYPMNALANSQVVELEKFLLYGFDGRPPVTYKRYTGQEQDEERDEIIKNPPDIILTNYVMLELIMTRPRERGLVEAMRGLQYLVLDELHTYRGRQAADVAMLVRRVRANQTATPRVIVEFEGEAGQLIRDIPTGVSLHLIGIEIGPTADRLVRFFRCPDIQPLVTAAGEEAVDQKRQRVCSRI